MTEPKIVINGTRLSDGQAMVVRVAVSDMGMQMVDPFIRDQIGEDVARGYAARCIEVTRIMLT
jgi:hypothetical protein